MKLKQFFAPTYKKLAWFFLILFIAQLYVYLIMPYVPTQVMQGFINFILNPATIIFSSMSGVETSLFTPISITLNAMWNYFLATLIVKELGKD
jgi:hypothetical protein